MIRLGLRLALAGGRPAVVRVCLMAAGIAIGLALVLAAASVPFGFLRESERIVRDSPKELDESAPDPHVLWAVSRLEAPGAPSIVSIAVAARRRNNGPVPPGTSQVPRPGEVLVSPALERALANATTRESLPRMPGRVVGRIGHDGLAQPDELVLITGWEYGALDAASPHALRVASFEEIDGWAGLGPALALIAAIPLVVIGAPVLLAPVLVFIGSTARIGARRREMRLAAMRLVGATPGQVRLIAAVEAMAAGVFGAAGGIALAWGVRATLARRGRIFASDFTLRVDVVALVVLVIVALAGASAVFALRRIEVTPLGVTRRRPARPVTRARWLALSIGWVLVLAGWSLPGMAATVVISLGFVMVMVGLVRGGPRLVQRLAGALGRAVRTPGSLLAARRLEADPRAGFRAGAAVTLTLFAALLAIVVTSSLDLQDRREEQRDARYWGVPASGGPDLIVRGSSSLLGPEGANPAIVEPLARVHGVEAAIPVYASLVPSAPQDATPEEVRVRFRQRVVVADCADFVRAVRAPAKDCRAGVLMANRTPPGLPLTLTFRAPDGSEFPFTVPVSGRLPVLNDDTLLESQGLNDWTTQLTGVAALVPPSLVPVEARARGEVTDVVLRTDGSVAAARRIAGVLVAQAPGLDATARIRRAQVDVDRYRESVRPLFYGMLIFVLVVAVCSLAVTTIDSVFERRRPLATLCAVGASPATLRRSVAFEVAAPVLAAGALGMVNGLVAGVVLVSVIDAPIVVPWVDLVAFSALVCGGWVVVAAIAVGAVGRVTTTESLRTA